ncbi:MAG TPA: hypothetical protein VJ801_20625 [Polyangia bacterium]|nr:hypothetical protein [Polyangia bacterium]
MTKLRIGALLIALCGCGSSGGKNNAPSGGDAGRADTVSASDTRSADVSSTATPDAAPPITSAPPAWERPADCGGIGDTCESGIFGCSTKSMCQLEGYVCVPLAPKTSDPRPYCMAYSCMSFEEASCFCTGAAAKQFPRCADGPAAVVGLCAATGDSCASKSCCTGLTCVTSSSGAGLCQRLCKTGSDCASGCCFDKDETGQPVCSDASLCASSCGKIGTSCTNSTDCCTGLCVSGTTVTDWVGCRRPCTKSSDCSTGCCEMFAGGTSGFCVDARWCTCGTSGTACGSTSPTCCSDQECSNFAVDTGALCRPRCKTTADCAVGTCSSYFADKDYGVCYQ